MRALGSPGYVSFIQAVGDGLNNITLCPFESVMSIPRQYLSLNLLDDIFGSLADLSDQEISVRQILCSTNGEVNYYNYTLVDMFPGVLLSLQGSNSLGGAPSAHIINNYTPEILDRLNFVDLPPTLIKIKLNSPLIIIKNYDIAAGIVNGTRGILKTVFFS
ncbi:hypothetical protein CDIK_4228 [Cucumispora dikerogammari]|nr:hypothetical protein CDIK_4228 [Cucumispora dikerogammari]